MALTAPGTRSLILYATPTGALADACQRYFTEATARLGPTAAQAYPPHCTLTGFFRRSPRRGDAVVAEMHGIVAAAGPVPERAVEVVAPERSDHWVGLELRSSWLTLLTARIVAAHHLEPGDDPLRPKVHLHLSLAYDVDDVGPYRALADELVDPRLPARWEVAVWERSDRGSWIRHGSAPVRADP